MQQEFDVWIPMIYAMKQREYGEDLTGASLISHSGGVICSLLFSRYHNLDAEFHARWNKQRSSPWMAKDLESYHGIASSEGLGQISETSVSFHLKHDQGKASRRIRMRIAQLPDDGMRRYHAIIYNLCNATAAPTRPSQSS